MTEHPTDAMPGNNPWPEDSDYGKLWRRGYDAGRADSLKPFMKLATVTAKPSTPCRGRCAKCGERCRNCTCPSTPIDDEGLLSRLAENTNLELTWGPVKGDMSDCAWHVHRVNGGYNDREWTLVATGETPSEALRKALVSPNVS